MKMFSQRKDVCDPASTQALCSGLAIYDRVMSSDGRKRRQKFKNLIKFIVTQHRSRSMCENEWRDPTASSGGPRSGITAFNERLNARLVHNLRHLN